MCSKSLRAALSRAFAPTSCSRFLRLPISTLRDRAHTQPPVFSAEHSHRAAVSAPAPRPHRRRRTLLPGVDGVLRHSHLPSHLIGLSPRFNLLDRANHLRFRVVAFTHPLSPLLRPIIGPLVCGLRGEGHSSLILALRKQS